MPFAPTSNTDKLCRQGNQCLCSVCLFELHPAGLHDLTELYLATCYGPSSACGEASVSQGALSCACCVICKPLLAVVAIQLLQTIQAELMRQLLQIMQL